MPLRRLAASILGMPKDPSPSHRAPRIGGDKQTPSADIATALELARTL
jgi:hypothetical protein